MNYKNIYKRNYLIIDRKLQKKISNTKIIFVGCGLGSNIAILAARTGFKKMILIDGDKVEPANLNRQYFFTKDIGKNKAQVVGKYIESINKSHELKVIKKYLTDRKEIDKIIKRGDIIINTADFGRGFYEILESVAKYNKIAFAPFNVGYGCVITAFNRKNLKKIRLLKALNTKSDGESFPVLLSGAKNYSIPRHFLPIAKKIFTGKIKKIPQLGISSNINSSVIVTLIIRYIQSYKNVPIYPITESINLM